MRWLPEPPPGTPVCGGFDGSEVDDATVIRLETLDGYQFTPRRTDDDERPTIWLPAQEPGGTIPRVEVHAAWERIVDRYKVQRVYCDPYRWQTEVEDWASVHGEDRFISWATNRERQMHEAIVRFYSDLSEGRITHDGCPVTATHMANARKRITTKDRYILGKPAVHQKIDAAVTSVIAHEAAADARAAGWTDEPAYILLP